MKCRTIGILLTTLGVVLPISRCSAQNVSGYDSIENPYLLLLREPAIHEELGLTRVQQLGLQKVNDEVDGPLMALRNWPAPKANEKFQELLQRTRDEVDTLLDTSQRARLSQVMLQLKGIKLVLTPQVADHLKLSPAQIAPIERVVRDTAAEITALQKRLQDGEPREQLDAAARLARQREQRNVLGELTDDQRHQLSLLLGRSFDASGLGRTKFKAPEFIDSTGWINTPGLRITDLRGQVVAVHFWTFG
jgi:hypothetical protein